MTNKVLITGASGLLGRAVAKKFGEEGWQVCGLAYSRATDHLLKVNLLDFEAVDQVVTNIKPDIIVHCAAERRPDVVENNYENSWTFNVKATEAIVKSAKKNCSSVIFISTDYVFDGENPPFKIEDRVNPLNKYGVMKVEGEKVVADEDSGSCILRIPLLYGDVENVEESGVTALLKDLLNKDVPKMSSNYEIRYPADTRDVAAVIHLLASKKLKDPEAIGGIYQWRGNQSLTKYEMTQIIAETFNLDMQHIKPYPKPFEGAKRPYNVKLDTSRLTNLGAQQSVSFKDGVKDALAKFIS